MGRVDHHFSHWSAFNGTPCGLALVESQPWKTKDRDSRPRFGRSRPPDRKRSLERISFERSSRFVERSDSSSVGNDGDCERNATVFLIVPRESMVEPVRLDCVSISSLLNGGTPWFTKSEWCVSLTTLTRTS
jgi:hypothetical protein